jgi:hypothetical protein
MPFLRKIMRRLRISATRFGSWKEVHRNPYED